MYIYIYIHIYICINIYIDTYIYIYIFFFFRLTRFWYRNSNARNLAHSAPSTAYSFPPRPPARLKTATKLRELGDRELGGSGVNGGGSGVNGGGSGVNGAPDAEYRRGSSPESPGAITVAPPATQVT